MKRMKKIILDMTVKNKFLPKENLNLVEIFCPLDISPYYDSYAIKS